MALIQWSNMNRILLLLCVGICVCSCDIQSNPSHMYERMFLPGECLSSNKLKNYEIAMERSALELRFAMDPSYVSVGEPGRRLKPYYVYHIPEETRFETLKNPEAVMNQYYDVFASWLEKIPSDKTRYDMITLLYCGGAELTSNVDIAGLTAGQNIMPFCEIDPFQAVEYMLKDYTEPIFSFDTDYEFVMGKVLRVIIPWSVLSEIEENQTITFSLKVPVKKVLYLKWLDEKVENPDTPLIYEDIVLSGKSEVVF